MWFDTLAIPKDAPDPQEAHELINFLIRPDVAAKNTNYVSYANGDTPTRMIDKAILRRQDRLSRRRHHGEALYDHRA